MWKKDLCVKKKESIWSGCSSPAVTDAAAANEPCKLLLKVQQKTSASTLLNHAEMLTLTEETFKRSF